ncbi:MAG: class I SAM-dependent methyltransferase [Marinilabiliaceae bacterium]|nr:class I SAM-dependent methyltransferase [Marinilabiliaceae bacterium]
MGLAGLDYLQGEKNGKITVRSNIAEDDYIPVKYLFRTFHQMPGLEQKALILCQGKVLDIGSGVGSHALYLQEKGLSVDCLDISPVNIQVASQRGVKNTISSDFFDFTTTDKYDTLLLLMNGIGIAGQINHLPKFFEKVRDLLAPGGQVLMDSSDLRYLYIDEDSYCIPLQDRYYGEVTYNMRYKNAKSEPFEWLFIDEALMKKKATENGFTFEKIADGDHYDYLARLSLIS